MFGINELISRFNVTDPTPTRYLDNSRQFSKFIDSDLKIFPVSRDTENISRSSAIRRKKYSKNMRGKWQEARLVERNSRLDEASH